jgi:hypothetical protein
MQYIYFSSALSELVARVNRNDMFYDVTYLGPEIFLNSSTGVSLVFDATKHIYLQCSRAVLVWRVV